MNNRTEHFSNSSYSCIKRGASGETQGHLGNKFCPRGASGIKYDVLLLKNVTQHWVCLRTQAPEASGVGWAFVLPQVSHHKPLFQSLHCWRSSSFTRGYSGYFLVLFPSLSTCYFRVCECVVHVLGTFVCKCVEVRG